uniref:RRM domain-containing protein n=1 Tax=Rhodnius prolixus TaxID=13249 RepID=T1I3I8_RHOPR
MDEVELTKMFSEFGRVHQINVLRDKVTGQSKDYSNTEKRARKYL